MIEECQNRGMEFENQGMEFEITNFKHINKYYYQIFSYLSTIRNEINILY